MTIKRRAFLKQSQQIGLGLGLLSMPILFNACKDEKKESKQEEVKEAVKGNASPFKISLAQWSLNKAIFSKEMDNLDFAKVTKRKFDIDAIEYVCLLYTSPSPRD